MRSTPLQDFIGRLGPESLWRLTEQVSKPELRAPSAVSLSVLMMAGHFHDKLSQTIRDVVKGAEPQKTLPFDVVAFEAAAFCHYQLMADDLTSDFADNDEWEDDDVIDSDESTPTTYFEANRDAVHFSASFLNDYCRSWNLPEEFFLNRVVSYSASTKDVAPLAMFERLLSGGIQEDVPIRRQGPPPLDLPLTLGVKAYIAIFQRTMIPGLAETCRRLVDHYR